MELNYSLYDHQAKDYVKVKKAYEQARKTERKITIATIFALVILLLVLVGVGVALGLIYGLPKATPTVVTVKKNHGERCSVNDDCLTNLNLYCSSGVCSCNIDMYHNDSLCITKKQYASSCLSNKECDDSKNIFCLSSNCTCKDNYLYDGTKCLKGYMDPCISTSECFGNLECLNSYCVCNLPITQKMFWKIPSCAVYPTSCREIKASQPSAASGLYFIGTPVGVLEAYCEMVIDGGGYTFLSWKNLDYKTDRFKYIYNDTSKVLFRLISRVNNNTQPYILTKQLNIYSNVSIGVYDNGDGGIYASTSASKPYVYIGYLPNSLSTIQSTTQGLAGNGQQVTFTNCDGNPNSMMVFYQNLVTYDPVPNLNYLMVDQWKGSALSHPSGTFMPVDYFYMMYIGMGGCGCAQYSNKWTDYYGVAFGLK